jgi:hypothetical protein
MLLGGGGVNCRKHASIKCVQHMRLCTSINMHTLRTWATCGQNDATAVLSSPEAAAARRCCCQGWRFFWTTAVAGRSTLHVRPQHPTYTASVLHNISIPTSSQTHKQYPFRMCYIHCKEGNPKATLPQQPRLKDEFMLPGAATLKSMAPALRRQPHRDHEDCPASRTGTADGPTRRQ